MAKNLPKKLPEDDSFPLLEEVVGAINTRHSESQERGRDPNSKYCPILRRKTGGDGEVLDLGNGEIVCEYFQSYKGHWSQCNTKENNFYKTHNCPLSGLPSYGVYAAKKQK